MVRLVALRRMGRVEPAPVGLRTVPDLLAEPHRIAAPVERDDCISSLGPRHDAAERRRLPAAVEVHDRGQLRAPLREAIKRCNRGGLPFEDAHPVANDPAHHPILLPLLQHLGVKRLFPRIEADPQFRDGGGHLPGVKRGQRVRNKSHWQRTGDDQKQDSHEHCHGRLNLRHRRVAVMSCTMVASAGRHPGTGPRLQST